MTQEFNQNHLEQAKNLDAKGKYADALRECDLALQQSPDDAIAHNFRGLLLESLGREEEALLAYQRAVELNPDFQDAKENERSLQEELEEAPAKFVMPPRPLGTYFWLLWCLSGFLFFILREFGFYNLYGQTWIGPAPLTWSDFISNGLTSWLTYPREVQIVSVVSLFWVVAFVLLGLGVFLGLGWGRKYLIVASIGYFVWRVIESSLGFISVPLYSLTAIFFISWYFRRGNVREYFGVEIDDTPDWLKIQIGGKLPLDLFIGISLLVVVLLLEVVGLIILLLVWRNLNMYQFGLYNCPKF